MKQLFGRFHDSIGRALLRGLRRLDSADPSAELAVLSFTSDDEPGFKISPRDAVAHLADHRLLQDAKIGAHRLRAFRIEGLCDQSPRVAVTPHAAREIDSLHVAQ